MKEKQENKQGTIIPQKEWVIPGIEIISTGDIESGFAGAHEAHFPSFPQSALAVS